MWHIYKLIRLRPNDKIVSSKRLSAFDRLRMSLSQKLLLRLRDYYEKYAFHDEIRIAGGKEIVIFDYRDTSFEAELKRRGFGFELRPSLHPRKDLYTGAATKLLRKRHYKDFDFNPSITIKNTVIKENNKISVSTYRVENNKNKKLVNPNEPLIIPRIIVRVEGAEIDNSF